MERLFISIALVQKMEGETTRWMLREIDGQLKFIVGNRLEKESFRETVTREVAWQLQLDRATDVLVSNMSQLSVEFGEEHPDYGERHVALAFYNVHLNRSKVIEAVDADPATAWVTAAEICEGKTKNGRLIQPDVVTWINKYEIIRPWQT